MPIGGRMPRGVRRVQLPPIRVSDASFTPLRDGDFKPIDDAYRERRRDLLLDAYDEARAGRRRLRDVPVRPPRAALRARSAARADRRDARRGRSSSARSATSCRLQQKPEREREMLELGRRAGSTRSSCTAIAASPASRRRSRSLPSSAAGPLHGVRPADGDRRRARAGGRDARRGRRVRRRRRRRASSCSQRRSPRSGTRASAHLTWRVLAGPNIPDAGMRAAAAISPGRSAIVERSRVDFGSLLRRAFVSDLAGGLQHDARRDGERRAAGARSVHRQRRNRAARAWRAAARIRSCASSSTIER